MIKFKKLILCTVLFSGIAIGYCDKTEVDRSAKKEAQVFASDVSVTKNKPQDLQNRFSRGVKTALENAQRALEYAKQFKSNAAELQKRVGQNKTLESVERIKDELDEIRKLATGAISNVNNKLRFIEEKLDKTYSNLQEYCKRDIKDIKNYIAQAEQVLIDGEKVLEKFNTAVKKNTKNQQNTDNHQKAEDAKNKANTAKQLAKSFLEAAQNALKKVKEAKTAQEAATVLAKAECLETAEGVIDAINKAEDAVKAYGIIISIEKNGVVEVMGEANEKMVINASKVVEEAKRIKQDGEQVIENIYKEINKKPIERKEQKIQKIKDMLSKIKGLFKKNKSK